MENQEQNNQQTPQPQKTYNPFLVNVNEKPYSQMNVETDPNKLAVPIPEPSIQSNTVRSGEDAYNMLNGDFGIGAGANNPTGGKQQSAPFNPAMNSVPDADKQMGAEHLAKLVVDGYEQLHVFANKALQIPERKLRKMVADGEIDLSVTLPFDMSGNTITAGEFIQDFNEQNKDTLTVTKEFKKEVTPVLKRVLEKRGAGLTDEQYLLYLFGKDIAVKGVIVSQVRSTMKDMLEIIKEHTLAMREHGQVVTGTPVQRASKETGNQKPPKNDNDGGDVPPSRPTPPPPPPSVPVNTDDFNFVTNEVVLDSAVQKHKVPDSGKARLMQQKKRDKEIAEAMRKAEGLGHGVVPAPNQPSYKDIMAKKKTGQRGRRGKSPADYVAEIDEAEIAEAIVLNESKPVDKDKIEGLE
jgi:hypothetical protein